MVLLKVLRKTKAGEKELRLLMLYAFPLPVPSPLLWKGGPLCGPKTRLIVKASYS